MAVIYETDNLTFNQNLKMKLEFVTVEYSENNSCQPVSESSNKTDYQGMNLSNLEDNFWAVFDEQYLRYNLGWAIILVVAYTLIFLIGSIGNCMVILVLLKRSQMRTVTNIFIMNLAFADLLLIVFCVPAELLYDIFKPWILGSVMFKCVRYIERVSTCASAYSLVAISLDRCKAIYRPQVPPRGFSKQQAIFAICLIWTFAITLNIPMVVFRDVFIVNGIPLCFYVWEYENIYYFIVMLFLFFCFPLNIIFISNIILWWNISKRKVPEESASASRIHRMHRESRQSVRKMLGIVTLAFLLCWLPLYVFSTKEKFVLKVSHWEKNILHPLSKLLAFSNSSMNPVLYAFLSIKFWEMFKSLLPKWVACIHRAEKTFVKNNEFRETISNGALLAPKSPPETSSHFILCTHRMSTGAMTTIRSKNGS